jgi:hypothetical protein
MHKHASGRRSATGRSLWQTRHGALFPSDAIPASDRTSLI